MKNRQEQTRFLLLSPETSQDKILAVLEYQGRMLSDREAHRGRIKQHPERKALIERVKEIRKQKIEQVNLDDDLMGLVLDRFKQKKSLQPRHMRDFRYLVSLVKSHALCNYDNRMREGSTIWANEDDVTAGIRLYSPIELSNEYGLPPEAFRLFMDLIQGRFERLARMSVLAEHYRDFYGRPIAHSKLNEIMRSLATAGLIEMDIPDPLDRRYKCFRELR